MLITLLQCWEIKSAMCNVQVMVTLRFFATGTFQSAVGDSFGASQPTASRAIGRVSQAIVCQMPKWVHTPTQPQADSHKLKFYRMARFPDVIGCVDGTHVRIQAPSVNENEYVNLSRSVRWSHVFGS